MKLTFLRAVVFIIGIFLTEVVFASADTILNTAVEVLAQSNIADIEANKMIIDANDIRKKINVTRARSRKFQDSNTKAELIKLASDLATELEQLQRQSATLRTKSIEQKNQALQLFEQGFCEKWKPWVSNRAPLTMDDSVTKFIAHNTNIRSVHPSMLNKMGTSTEIARTDTNNNMSILIPALAAQNAPPDLNISAFKISREEKYFAHIEVQPEQDTKTSSASDKIIMSNNTSNNVAAIPLNKMHKWRFLLSDLSGNPVTQAKIDIEGHMPGHVHGLPTQPQITKEVAAGVYQVEGVKFQMKGWWVIQFNINTPTAKADVIKFNLVL